MMDAAQVKRVSGELDEMAIMENDPVVKAKLRSMAAALRVLDKRYKRSLRERATIHPEVKGMLF